MSNSIQGKHRKAIAFVFMSLMAMNFVFAASEDFGFNEYFAKIRTFLVAIGGVLLVVSICLWAIKAIVKRDIEPKDWKAIGIMFIGGILLILAPTIIGSIFDGLDTSAVSN